jgi:hypothetical protein
MTIIEGKLRRAAILLSLPAAAFGGYWAWQHFDYPAPLDVCFNAGLIFPTKALGDDCERWARDATANAGYTGGTYARQSGAGTIYNSSGLSQEAFAAASERWVSDYNGDVFRHREMVVLFWVKVLAAAGIAASAVWALAFAASWVIRG